MRPGSRITGPHTAWLSCFSLDSPRPSTPRPFTPSAVLHSRLAVTSSSQALRRLVALAILPLVLLVAPRPLHAQSQYGQYSQPQYQANPNAQQSYPASNQAIPDPAYDQGQPPSDYAQSQPQPLGAEQLEQLLAPIALYPDTLVAQILAAATYPAQVAGADHWLAYQGYASPDQIAAGADAQPWDPSVKALTAFPQVLAQMDRDLQWTTDLGNAYYNQPQDVLQTVQVLRQRAQAAGTLQNTPQEAVSYNQGYIQLAPVNPQVVYVPAYNPWDVYGQPVTPYQNFSLLGSLSSLAGSSPVKFGLGIAMSAFNHTPFGWATWALNWLTQSVLFHQSNYSSTSASVAHWGNPSSGGQRQAPMPLRQDAYNRTQSNQPQASYGRPATEYSRQVFGRQPDRNPENYAENRPYADNRPAEYPNHGYPNRDYANRNYPAQSGNYARPQPLSTPARQQAYNRPGYASGFYGSSPQRESQYNSRPPAAPYANQRQEFAQRSYLGDRSSSGYGGSSYGNRTFAESKPPHSGGFHLFGGGHSSEKSYGGGHAPKNYGGGKGSSKSHSGGGGHSGSHHGGSHRF
jgi:hypothetical protein